jgi:hypothetical protein
MASKSRTFRAVITSTERMNSSTNGNPRFRAFLSSGDALPTEPDAMLAYGFENPGNIGQPVLLTVNGRGWITHLDPIPPEEWEESDDLKISDRLAQQLERHWGRKLPAWVKTQD